MCCSCRVRLQFPLCSCTCYDTLIECHFQNCGNVLKMLPSYNKLKAHERSLLLTPYTSLCSSHQAQTSFPCYIVLPLNDVVTKTTATAALAHHHLLNAPRCRNIYPKGDTNTHQLTDSTTRRRLTGFICSLDKAEFGPG